MYYFFCLAIYAIITSNIQRRCRSWGDQSGAWIGCYCGAAAVLFFGGLALHFNVPYTTHYEEVVSRQIQAAYPGTGTFILQRIDGGTAGSYLRCQINLGIKKGWQDADFESDRVHFVYNFPPDRTNSYSYLRLRTKSRWRQILFLTDLEDWSEEDSNKGIYRLYLNDEPDIR